MQLKLKRSQREGGVLSKSVVFCLDARAEYTAIEQQNILRYKLQNEVVYNSEASRRNLESADKMQDGSASGGFKSLGFALLAGMKLNISISSLERGHHIECKSMDELLGAEQALISACRNLKEYLDAANTFDGREVLINFDAEEPAIVATATTPELKLISAPSTAPKTSAYEAATPPPISDFPPGPTVALSSPSGTTSGFWLLLEGKSYSQLTTQQKRTVLMIVGAVALLLVLAMCTLTHPHSAGTFS